MKICCEVLLVSRSGYYKYLRAKQPKLNNLLLTETKALHTQSRGSYGSRRIAKALQAKGYQVGRFKARSLMRAAGLECKQRSRFRKMPRVDPNIKAAENVLNREFAVSEPNKVWVCDITYLDTREGWRTFDGSWSKTTGKNGIPSLRSWKPIYQRRLSSIFKSFWIR